MAGTPSVIVVASRARRAVTSAAPSGVFQRAGQPRLHLLGRPRAYPVVGARDQQHRHLDLGQAVAQVEVGERPGGCELLHAGHRLHDGGVLEPERYGAGEAFRPRVPASCAVHDDGCGDRSER